MNITDEMVRAYGRGFHIADCSNEEADECDINDPEGPCACRKRGLTAVAPLIAAEMVAENERMASALREAICFARGDDLSPLGNAMVAGWEATLPLWKPRP
jgi:hypothetical protein